MQEVRPNTPANAVATVTITLRIIPHLEDDFSLIILKLKI